MTESESVAKIDELDCARFGLQGWETCESQTLKVLIAIYRLQEKQEAMLHTVLSHRLKRLEDVVDNISAALNVIESYTVNQ